MKMITAENLPFFYCESKCTVLHGFSLSLEEGRVYGLLGKDGAGKPTLLYLMNSLPIPRSGRVLYHGTDVRCRLPITSQDMFLIPEEFDLPPASLISYVGLNSLFYPRFSKKDMMKYLYCFEMNINIDLGALSMGQKKKVFMSSAFATSTSLLLMDEPTSGSDIPGKNQSRKPIASGMTDDKTILISIHQVHDTDKVLDHVLIMDNGRMLLNESVMGICNKLFFTGSDDQTLLQPSLYSALSIQGNLLFLPNGSGGDSEINLGLLSNATLAVPEGISALFHTEQPEL